MEQIKPHIFFHSDIDSSEEWRAALATQLEEFAFSADTVSTPESVDIALIWRLPDGGLDRFSNLRAILSLGAGIDQLDPERRVLWVRKLPTAPDVVGAERVAGQSTYCSVS